MIKGSILQEDITILNVHAHNNKVLKYIWQNLTELQGKVDESPIIVADFNTPQQKWTDPAGRNSVST